MTDTLLEMYRSGSGRMTKLPEYLPTDDAYRSNTTSGTCANALWSLVDRETLTAAAEAKAVVYPKVIAYSVTEKTSEILTRIKTRGAMRLGELFGEARSRTEMVAVFIAVLELCRSGGVYLIGYDEELTLCASSPDDCREPAGENVGGEPPDGEPLSEWAAE